MTVVDFWIKANNIINEHRHVYIDPNTSADEQRENITSFLSEIDLLVTEWSNRDGAKEVEK